LTRDEVEVALQEAQAAKDRAFQSAEGARGNTTVSYPDLTHNEAVVALRKAKDVKYRAFQRSVREEIDDFRRLKKATEERFLQRHLMYREQVEQGTLDPLNPSFETQFSEFKYMGWEERKGYLAQFFKEGYPPPRKPRYRRRSSESS
jgi:hypothetical protein